MNKNYFIGLISLIIGCTTPDLCYLEEYNIYDNSAKQFTISIPCNYNDVHHFNDEGYDYIYLYKDSTAIYISHYYGDASLNYENIKSVKGYFDKFLNAQGGPDTLTLEGFTKKGLKWKSISIKEFNYGYVNVPSNKVDLYDKALNSFYHPERQFKRKSM